MRGTQRLRRGTEKGVGRVREIEGEEEREVGMCRRLLTALLPSPLQSCTLSLSCSASFTRQPGHLPRISTPSFLCLSGCVTPFTLHVSSTQPPFPSLPPPPPPPLLQGADVMIFERLAEEGNPHRDATREHLEKFGADGLRTLCLAYRELPADLYREWNERYVVAKSALREREKRLDEVRAR